MEGLTLNIIDKLKRKELQTYAKQAGIRANQKSSVLKEKLIALVATAPSTDSNPTFGNHPTQEKHSEREAEEGADTAGSVEDNVNKIYQGEVAPTLHGDNPSPAKETGAADQDDVKETKPSEQESSQGHPTPQAAKAKTRKEWYYEVVGLQQENKKLREEIAFLRGEVNHVPRRRSIRKQWERKEIVIGGLVITPRAPSTFNPIEETVAKPSEKVTPVLVKATKKHNKRTEFKENVPPTSTSGKQILSRSLKGTSNKKTQLKKLSLARKSLGVKRSKTRASGRLSKTLRGLKRKHSITTEKRSEKKAKKMVSLSSSLKRGVSVSGFKKKPPVERKPVGPGWRF